ncbi:cyanophycin synthetase [Alkaliphilus oremlandii]|uniref:Cyanophycin synthetase n=1 Tax=Alkaliphilus oremlandii (strain OhILAs) TaxID=350688 RepID=A8MIL0_ALKOO|nr:cyanophycin synthetase [Alkaliphilus oremlandii]ABW19642.1 cyanophycin synthetase [Alkaliphilus oremlandii OhILAs]
MKLLSIKVYPGRNIYSHWPIVRVDVDLGRYVDIPTCDIEGFNERLLSILPGLKNHKCSKGYLNGFYERLESGTYLAHVMEHMAIEIQNILGYDLSFGKTRYLKNDTVYCLVFSYINPTVGYESATLAFDIIDSFLNNKSIDMGSRLLEIEKKSEEKELGPSTSAILEEAEKRKIPTIRIGEESILQLGYGKYQRRIQATMTDATSCMAVDIACDKELTNRILRNHGVPVPEGRISNTLEEVFEIVERLKPPIVVKPYNGNQGKGVSLNLYTKEEIIRAFHIAKQFSDKVLIEKFIEGKHYRITVVGGKVVAASERIAAHVIGDGVHNIQELIDIENLNPLRGNGHQKPLTRIQIDDVMNLTLDKVKMNLNTIPKAGEIVYLRENDNLSTGGIAIDVTDEVHPENIKLALRAARIIGLDIAGIDVTTKDITKSISENGGAIIEVNACPGIRMHHYPSKGVPRNVAKEIVNMLFPENAPHSVPIVSVTGTNGKTTTTRMIAKILKMNNMVVGMTSTGGVYIDNELIVKGDTTGPRSAEIVLMDKHIDIAVLETARGGIVNKGLGYDLADVGLVTNIDDDHMGIDGINTLEDMADVKSLVLEAIKPEGYAIINAEDTFARRMAERARGNIVYFSQCDTNELIIEHKKQGKKAIYLKEKKICIFDGNKEIDVIEIEKIPATLGGILEHNIENSLCAVAATFALGVDIHRIYEGLRDFHTDAVHNMGRFNVFEVANFKVILDYGHNIGGYNRVLNGLNKMKANRLIGVIGVPGDRTDISILKIGELSGKYFDQVYIKEDRDLRGRNVGQVAELIKKGCILGKLSEQQITTELDERVALEKAMKNAKEGDIIIVFYEEYEPLLDIIHKFKNEADQAVKEQPHVAANEI